eukprot:296604-Chlamydomonas_euryale.AAC.1
MYGLAVDGMVLTPHTAFNPRPMELRRPDPGAHTTRSEGEAPIGLRVWERRVCGGCTACVWVQIGSTLLEGGGEEAACQQPGGGRGGLAAPLGEDMKKYTATDCVAKKRKFNKEL